ncbi:MAG: hypothetical protein CSA23_02615 [Deltaproteobacteria bacterium]|nr:MAG: hypothetical protein CSA23_02615 [Deltaproteobacteria bacterium]
MPKGSCTQVLGAIKIGNGARTRIVDLAIRGVSVKSEQIYHELKELAEKLDVTVSEQSFRATGIPVKSGFCIIKGRMHCIIDKKLTVSKKTHVLARTLAAFPLENLYMVPAVRDMIGKSKDREAPGSHKKKLIHDFT